ncbi:hypothetical protein HBN54_000375 [Hymenobacter sp. 1B]|uniref:Uncharacterized protein n=1 Tax=Hymenobacter artigasi TaxID=2719616 RepID=A0ABX1HC23_9BACT|nr:hypothetical protein [Hymenobacter artigasi]
MIIEYNTTNFISFVILLKLVSRVAGDLLFFGHL